MCKRALHKSLFQWIQNTLVYVRIVVTDNNVNDKLHILLILKKSTNLNNLQFTTFSSKSSFKVRFDIGRRVYTGCGFWMAMITAAIFINTSNKNASNAIRDGLLPGDVEGCLAELSFSPCNASVQNLSNVVASKWISVLLSYLTFLVQIVYCQTCAPILLMHCVHFRR